MEALLMIEKMRNEKSSRQGSHHDRMKKVTESIRFSRRKK